MLKLAVFAPMPSVSVTNATAVKPGLRFSQLPPTLLRVSQECF